jgi:hypothetical protein
MNTSSSTPRTINSSREPNISSQPITEVFNHRKKRGTFSDSICMVYVYVYVICACGHFSQRTTHIIALLAGLCTHAGLNWGNSFLHNKRLQFTVLSLGPYSPLKHKEVLGSKRDRKRERGFGLWFCKFSSSTSQTIYRLE